MTTLAEERQAISDIASMLPPGYVKSIPFSISKNITFEFKGVTVKMSKLYLNEYLNCYMFDLAWGARDKIFGIPIRCGIDLLKQFKTPLPNMYSNNTKFPDEEATSWRNLRLFVIDAGVLENG